MSYASASTCTPTHRGRRSLIDRLISLSALWRSRSALSSLDAARLDDIGVSRHEAEIEARRALWDVPAHWTR
jgi:uncharacterized protein YjiS (DUF1127 family)